MTIELWIAFVIASSIMLVIPGPTILTVISYSMSHGRRANIPLITAVALGDSTALLLSIAGLGALLATSAWMFTAIKLIGGLYLIILGIKLFRAKHPHVDSADIEAEGEVDIEVDGSIKKLFFNAWLVTALNPKGIVFFVAFLPQFIDPTSPVVPQLWLLSVTFVLLATLSTALYATFATKARGLLSSPKVNQRLNFGGGSLLIIAGLWALTADKPVSM